MASMAEARREAIAKGQPLKKGTINQLIDAEFGKSKDDSGKPAEIRSRRDLLLEEAKRRGLR